MTARECLGWDVAGQADPTPRAARRDSTRAEEPTLAEGKGRALPAPLTAQTEALRAVPHRRDGVQPGERCGARGAAAGTARQGRAAAFPSVSRTGSAVVAAVAAAQESGHHGCLYYPPSNSNFFPSLLANYPASVLISFYYWN